MRPQHITAENAAQDAGVVAVIHASMRPQHITAENREPGFGAGLMPHASMRPQHITAENARTDGWSSRTIPSFNEAAAYHCGKPPSAIRRRGQTNCFNEAAAYHCGKLTSSPSCRPDSRPLQ